MVDRDIMRWLNGFLQALLAELLIKDGRKAVWADLAPEAHASDLDSLRHASDPECHPLYKTTTCKRQLGQCQEGSSCRNAHSNDELRQRPVGSKCMRRPVVAACCGWCSWCSWLP